MIYTYVSQSLKDNKWYTGSTRDLRRRFKEHNNGDVQSTKNRKPFKIIYFEACLNARCKNEREVSEDSLG